MKKFFNYLSSAALVAILLILIIPNWRVKFQGWTQGLFMGELAFEHNSTAATTRNVNSIDWVFTNIADEDYQFDSLQGKPTIISFWATWCPPCRAELVELKKIKEQFGDQINIIAVTEETKDLVVNSGLHNDYNFLFTTKRYPLQFQIQAFPTLIILDHNLKEVFKHSGAGKLTGENNIKFINELIQNS